jgi:ketosteroid isomerase-like protein
MSAENVEFVRGLVTATDSLSKEEMLAALPVIVAEACDPQIEFVETPERVDARTYRGHDGVLEAWTRWLEQWEEYSYEVDRIEDHGERVLCIANEQGLGKGSGAPGDAVLYAVFTIRGEKIARYEEFYNEAAARRTLGAD